MRFFKDLAVLIRTTVEVFGRWSPLHRQPGSLSLSEARICAKATMAC